MSMPRHLLCATTVPLLALLLASCASVPESSSAKPSAATAEAALNGAPDWSINPPQRSGMAYGVGSIEVMGDAASAVRRAGELARIDLLSQLRVTVSGDFTSTTSESSGTGKTSVVQRQVTETISSRVPEVTLDEISIAQASVNNGIAYALAELDRSAAAARLRQQITEIEQQLDQYTTVMPQGDALQQLRVMLPAMSLIAERQAYADKLGLVAENHRIPALQSEHRLLQQRVLGLLDKLVVRVEFINADASQMAGELLEVLTSQGMNVQQSGAADLVFQLSADRSSRQQDDRFYAFVKARVNILDNEQRVLSSFSDTARGVSGLENLAWQKASQAVAEQLQADLAATLAERLM